MRCTQVIGFTGRRCQAERILALSAVCFVCGGHAHERIALGPGDVIDMYAELLELAGNLVDITPSIEHKALLAAVTAAIITYELPTRTPLTEQPL